MCIEEPLVKRPGEVNPSYIVELAKSGRAECKRCGEKIENRAIRVGVILEGDWGLFTRWHHLACTIFHASLLTCNDIDGFHQLTSDHQNEVEVRFEASKKEEDEDMKPLDPDALVRKCWNTSIEPCSDLLMPLLPYQKEGLAWMLNQERCTIHGGILADEMGMGKTIQAVSIILQNRSQNSCLEEWKKSDISHCLQENTNVQHGGTLIIVPTIAIRQWQLEIARFTKDGCLKVKVYHGSDRNTTLDDLKSYDIIITSYKVLEIEYRKATAGTKVECRICGKKFYPEKLRLHRKYFCGENAKRTEAQAKTQKKSASTDDRSSSLGIQELSQDHIQPTTKGSTSAKWFNNNGDSSQRSCASFDSTKLESKGGSKRKLKDVLSNSQAQKDTPKRCAAVRAAANISKISYDDECDEADSCYEQSSENDGEINSQSFSKSRNHGKRFKTIEVVNYSDVKKSKSSVVDIMPSSKCKNSGKRSNKCIKKKFPGEPLSEGDSGTEKQLNPYYDSDVEYDITNALKAHNKLLKGNVPKSILHMVSWFRIILDEAHLIKDRSTSTAKAVFNLVSLNKWCLTGTPLQNRVGEIYSLIRFLRLDPHAFYFCKTKGCNCKSLHYRFTNSMCDECGHSVIHHYCHFNKHILNPIQRSGHIADGKKAMLMLKNQILDNILLRRTKLNRADDIQLPLRVVKVRREKLDEREEDFYQALYTQSQAQFNTYLAAGTVLNNYAHIFDILIRLRQAVDHPYLVIYGENQQTSLDSTFLAKDSNCAPSNVRSGDDLCYLCNEQPEDLVYSGCGDCFCRLCITDFMSTVASNEDRWKQNNKLSCPKCEKPLTLNLDSTVIPIARKKKSILDKLDPPLFQSSTKMEALMEELYRMELLDPGAKAIVFSQFVNMLDLLEYRIRKGGFSCVKLLGSMTIEQRDKTVSAFKTDPSIKVLLISLKAGGVALNLTVANYIFLMDPWWNPAAEMQAIDRTHRIGQYKTIFATRFIIENTIEERILRLQEKKKLVFDGTVGGDVGSMTKLTVEDIRFLFQ